jgi:hypothetical protein
VAVHSEMVLKRACQFLLSYAAVVYNEEELNNMRKMFTVDESVDISFDDK